MHSTADSIITSHPENLGLIHNISKVFFRGNFMLPKLADGAENTKDQTQLVVSAKLQKLHLISFFKNVYCPHTKYFGTVKKC